jgi:hypothetical protein
VDISYNLTFGDIEVNTGLRAKLFDYVQEGYYILRGVYDECAAVCLPFTGQFEATRGLFVALVRVIEPVNTRFDH